MIILLYLGRLLILLALSLLAFGVVLWLSGADVTLPAGRLWYELDAASLNATQVIVQRYLSLPAVWDDFLVPWVLTLPAWEAILWVFIVLMILGGALCLPARRGRRRSFKGGL